MHCLSAHLAARRQSTVVQCLFLPLYTCFTDYSHQKGRCCCCIVDHTMLLYHCSCDAQHWLQQYSVQLSTVPLLGTSIVQVNTSTNTFVRAYRRTILFHCPIKWAEDSITQTTCLGTYFILRFMLPLDLQCPGSLFNAKAALECHRLH